MSYDSPVRKGNSNVLEIPLSAAVLPFIGTTMRVSPMISRVLQKYIFYEAAKTEKPVVFLFHPNECLDKGEKVVDTRRASGIFEYVFTDLIRHRLKLNNLGMASLRLLDKVISDAKEYGFEFVSVKEYVRIARKL